MEYIQMHGNAGSECNICNGTVSALYDKYALFMARNKLRILEKLESWHLTQTYNKCIFASHINQR